MQARLAFCPASCKGGCKQQSKSLAARSLSTKLYAWAPIVSTVFKKRVGHAKGPAAKWNMHRNGTCIEMEHATATSICQIEVLNLFFLLKRQIVPPTPQPPWSAGWEGNDKAHSHLCCMVFGCSPCLLAAFCLSLGDFSVSF